MRKYKKWNLMYFVLSCR